jgi:hypothetical protein
MHLDDEDSEKPQVPESVLKAALLRRAQEDVQRVIQMRNSKQALATLLQKGSIGDDLWFRFLRAEQEVEEEIRDVVAEVCLALHTQWGNNKVILTMTGKCVLRKLGSIHLSICTRNATESRHQKTIGRLKSRGTGREGVVG